VKLSFYIDDDLSKLGLSLKTEGEGEYIVELKILNLMEFLDENTSI
jgi:hypothetical protein